ncbi:hypothetical protein SLH46_07715 [Draconibacterium sp. IB214405]|uniref:hypothetical protein n=1 Tax=Draconibacterium sp. IB214405 TaxID=3097352 RepID=UPI002A0B6C7D|nr:hypothetical protein [Draconibacterium sp. IB214405]MDX8339066.1 hypothetical protein [Draconibacterium sp. IB214405]
MKSYRNNHSKEDWQLTNIWDAFVDHVDSIYFAGASELLDKRTLAFELDSFTTYYRKDD